MQKWEYLDVGFHQGKDKKHHLYLENGKEVHDMEHGPEQYEYIRQLGEQGWELAASSHPNSWIFKRPKQ